MVNSRLGPGTWMNRMEAIRKASHWLDVGMGSFCVLRLTTATSIGHLDIVADVIFKRVGTERPYPAHGLSARRWAEVPPTQVRLDDLVTTKATLQLDALLDEDSTFYGDLFAHVVRWRGDLYLEDGLHRALRAALQQRNVVHARVYAADD
jgi:Arc/MetJ family transcription regulator